MATDTMMTTCTFDDISQTTKCYEQNFGCTLNREGPGPCATLDCPDGSLFVCEKTPESQWSGLHDLLGENRVGYLIDDPCHCC